MITNIILLLFPEILNAPLGYRVCGNGFLQQQISLVLFVLDNATNTAVSPLHLTLFVYLAKCLQLICNGISTIALQIQFKNQSHCFCFRFIYGNGLALRMIVIAKAPIEAHKFSTFHLHLNAQLNILGCGFHFVLSQRSHKRKHHFPLFRQGIDILFFKNHCNPSFL